MRMNKIIAMLLAGTLTALMGTTALASEASDAIQKVDTKEIKATYNGTESTPKTVYYVDVEWGSLEYTYSSGDSKKWNPQTLVFEKSTGSPAWTYANGANTIKVINHSNIGITTTFSYKETNSSGVSGSFSKEQIALAAPAENSDVNNAPSGSTELTLDGQVSDTITGKSVVGNVTVTITDGALVCMTEGRPNNLPMYATDEKGVYKVTFSPSYDNQYVYINFTIGGKKYVMWGGNEIHADGYGAGYPTNRGKNYEFLFNINTMTYTVTVTDKVS